jgi:DNA-binding transcriptional ArsR family regulator
VSPEKVACLRALVEIRDCRGEDFSYVGFAPIMEKTGLARTVVRRHVRALARAGLAEYARALCSEDGDFRGAGYQATALACASLAFIEGGLV